jgi:hypothetical protein
MELESGTILSKIAKDDYDLQVMASLGNTCAVKQLGKVHRSYAGVIAGLSLNPEILDVVEPLIWYETSELLRYYEVKENNGNNSIQRETIKRLTYKACKPRRS